MILLKCGAELARVVQMGRAVWVGPKHETIGLVRARHGLTLLLGQIRPTCMVRSGRA